MVRQREAFVAALTELHAERLVFLDESSFHTAMVRPYGWAPVGDKPVVTAPRYGKHLTVIGAIALDGVRATSLLDHAMDGPAFVAFLDETLGPTLRPGDVVVMDGPRVHRVAGVAEALAKWGATPLYLPPYSPELNPIEMCWSVLKAIVRGTGVRRADHLIEIVLWAWTSITATLCQGWVRHCGYRVPST